MMQGNLTLTGGASGSTQGGGGSAVVFGEGGNAVAVVNEWDARSADTSLTLTKNDAEASAEIAHLILGNKRTFTVKNTDGTYEVARYSVYDSAVFAGDTFHAAGKRLDFHLSEAIANNHTMLTVKGNADISGSTVNMFFSGGSTPLKGGDKVVLIDAATLHGMSANTQTSAAVTGHQGVSLVYDFGLSREGNRLIATLGSAGANPQTKAFLQGRLAQLAFIGQGADAVGRGVMGALHGLAPDFAYDLVPFFITRGGWSRYDTGSHVDVEGAAATAGLAWRGQSPWGLPVLAAFLEAGRGNHKTCMDMPAVTGKGDIAYHGAGILGHFDFKPLGPGNVYVEASFRAGHSDLEFRTEDIRDGFGRTVDFDSSAPYYGLHAGLGYRMNLDRHCGLEFYSTWYWTHLHSDERNILGDAFHFEALDSRRWRNGLRLSFDIPADGVVVKPFIGAAHEYEFSGIAEGSVHGHDLDEPGFRGGTGIGEVGVSLYPSDGEGVSLDLSVSGYTGRREGASGDLRLKWTF